VWRVTHSIPAEVIQLVPNPRLLVSQATIPTQCQEDRLIWKHITSRELSLKEAYDFKKQHYPKV